MATQPGTVRRPVRERTAGSCWRGYHIFYHGDRGQLLTELVRPTVEVLLRERWIQRFFFIRYHLGGPHVRLRLEHAPGRAGTVRDRVQEAATAYFARNPSTRPVPDEAVRRENRAILASDPLAAETEDAVYPDNSVREFPVVFEVERYGGAALLEESLGFFVISSVEVLHLLAEHGHRPAGARLVQVARVLLRQAWGFARNEADFADLLGYAVHLMGGPLAEFVSQGDRAYERSRAALDRLLREELAVLVGADPAEPRPRLHAGAEGARRLAREVRAGTDEEAQRRIALSQLHMTANRAGLLNPEEVYLGRMLWRAAGELAGADPSFWSAAWEAHRQQEKAAGRLSTMVGPALKTLCV
jgi:hypothetical protein